MNNLEGEARRAFFDTYRKTLHSRLSTARRKAEEVMETYSPDNFDARLALLFYDQRAEDIAETIEYWVNGKHYADDDLIVQKKVQALGEKLGEHYK